MGDAALYERDLIEDIIPLIDGKYRTLADRKHRAIVGFSMGGGQDGRFGLKHFEAFSQVGIMSAGLGGGSDREPLATLAANPQKANQQIDLLWIACGKEDTAMKGAMEAISPRSCTVAVQVAAGMVNQNVGSGSTIAVRWRCAGP